jgi:hypothetical protein
MEGSEIIEVKGRGLGYLMSPSSDKAPSDNIAHNTEASLG